VEKATGWTQNRCPESVTRSPKGHKLVRRKDDWAEFSRSSRRSIGASHADRRENLDVRQVTGMNGARRGGLGDGLHEAGGSSVRSELGPEGDGGVWGAGGCQRT
jgi:hypothetical protein